MTEFNGWDGTQNGALLERGTFIYEIELTRIDGEKRMKKGDIVLLR